MQERDQKGFAAWALEIWKDNIFQFLSLYHVIVGIWFHIHDIMLMKKKTKCENRT